MSAARTHDRVGQPTRTIESGGRLSVWAIRLGWAAVITPFVLEAIAIVRASEQFLVLHVPDDAFYYLEIARRIDHAQGFTFDGLHATNGFHPGWQLLLAGIGAFVPGSTAFLKAALLVQLVLVLGALLLVIRLVWRWLGPGPALMGAIIVVHARDGLSGYLDGMEGALTLLALAGLATVLVAWFRSPSTRRAVLVGALSAAVVFSRLDMIVVIWLVPAAMVWRTRRWRWGGWWAAGGAVGLPWALWSWMRYGHLLTVSATVKASEMTALAKPYGGRVSTGYAHLVLSTGNTYARSLLATANDSDLRSIPLVGWVTGVAVTALALIGVVSIRRRRRNRLGPADSGYVLDLTDAETERSATAWTFGVLGLALALKAGFDLVNAPVWALGWYSTPARFALGFALGALAWLGAIGLVGRRRWVGLLAIGYLAVVAIPLNGGDVAASRSSARFGSAWQDQLDQTAAWISTDGPPGRYAASDAGLLGYRLDGQRTLVNVDGLVNDYAFAAEHDRGATTLELLQTVGADYYVNRMVTSSSQALACARVVHVAAHDPGDAAVEVLDVRDC